jgi:Flp pilus assembly protein TadG
LPISPLHNEQVRVTSPAGRRSRNPHRGVYTVEFMFVIPLLIALLFGAIDGGRFVISHCMLRYAAIVGSRMASMPSTASATVVQTAAANASPFLALTTAAVTVVITNGATVKTFASRAVGDTATVTVAYNYHAFLTFFSKFGSRSYSATSAVDVE